MSSKITGLVWDSALPRGEKIVALALADHADHEGRNIYPSNGLIAYKTGYKVRAVQQMISRLEQRGVLVDEGVSHLKTNRWRMDTYRLPQRAPFRSKRTKPPVDNWGAKNAPPCKKQHPEGAENARGGRKKQQQGVQKMHPILPDQPPVDPLSKKQEQAAAVVDNFSTEILNQLGYAQNAVTEMAVNPAAHVLASYWYTVLNDGLNNPAGYMRKQLRPPVSLPPTGYVELATWWLGGNDTVELLDRLSDGWHLEDYTFGPLAANAAEEIFKRGRFDLAPFGSPTPVRTNAFGQAM